MIFISSDFKVLGADDDVSESHFLDQGQGFTLGSSPDGEHRQHGCHSEDHPKHRQDGSKLMEDQVEEGDSYRFGEEHRLENGG